MLLLDWYRQYLEIKYNSRKLKNDVVVEEKVCQSCETLRHQLEVANYEKQQILSKLLKEPEPVKETVAPVITRPVRLPWPARKQLLETEDREKARIMRNAPKPDVPPTVADVAELEKDLKVAEDTRTAEGQK